MVQYVAILAVCNLYATLNVDGLPVEPVCECAALNQR